MWSSATSYTPPHRPKQPNSRPAYQTQPRDIDANNLLVENIEAEKITLGSIFIDPPTIYEVADFLEPSHFFRETHAWIYQAMLKLADQNKPCDRGLVANELERTGQLELVGGRIELMSLWNNGTSHTRHYAKLVEEAAIKRGVLKAGEAACIAAQNKELNGEETLEAAQAALLDVQRPQGRGLLHVSSAVSEWVKAVDEGRTMGKSTGFRDLDRYIKGFRPGRLYVIGGRPGTGKSSLAKDFARAFIRRGERVAFFSLEMSGEEISQRIVASETRLNLSLVETMDLDEQGFALVSSRQGWLADCPLWIDDSGGLTPMELRTKVQREHLKSPIDLLIVDYIQKMRYPPLTGNRVQEVGAISSALKELARDLGIPVVALSSMNRAIENRGRGSDPTNADLRESGDIESDADLVGLLWPSPKEGEHNIMRLKITKQRNGPQDVTVEFYFDRECVQFHDLAY